jgi:tetratricopeptide (TPR) repeat protein
MAAAGTSLTPLKQGQALLCQGRLLYLYDRRLELELMLAALQLARQAGDPLLEQKALCECCRAHLHNGNLADALSHGEQAVALSRQLGDPVMLGAALAPYAEALHYQGAPGTAAVYLEALDLAERAGSAQTAAGLHNNYAMLLIDDGDLSGARRHLERALQWMGNEMTNRTMPMYAGLGWVVMQTGDAMKSAAYQADVLRAASLNGNVFMAACAVLGLACCASRRGESELAARLHGAADSLLSPVAQQWETLEANIREADIIDLRTRLGDGYETIYQEGKALPYPEVVKLGLGAR